MTHYIAPRKTLVAVGLFLMVFGGVGAWDFIRSLEPLWWQAVPCEVTRFEVVDDGGADLPFDAHVSFQFDWDGKIHEGTALGLAGWRSSRDAWTRALRVERDPHSTCYVPDGDPTRACLFRPPSTGAGLAFVGFAVFVGWILVAADRAREESSDVVFSKISIPVALLFGLPGVLMLSQLAVPVWMESMAVRCWDEVPATIEWSRIRTIQTGGKDRRTTSRAEIGYQYHADGRVWRQNRIFPGGLEAGGSSSHADLVATHPPGMLTTCWVDPAHPERSVLKPSVGWSLGWTFFALPFVGVAAMAIWSRQRVRSRRIAGS